MCTVWVVAMNSEPIIAFLTKEEAIKSVLNVYTTTEIKMIDAKGPIKFDVKIDEIWCRTDTMIYEVPLCR